MRASQSGPAPMLAEQLLSESLPALVVQVAKEPPGTRRSSDLQLALLFAQYARTLCRRNRLSFKQWRERERSQRYAGDESEIPPPAY